MPETIYVSRVDLAALFSMNAETLRRWIKKARASNQFPVSVARQNRAELFHIEQARAWHDRWVRRGSPSPFPRQENLSSSAEHVAAQPTHDFPLEWTPDNTLADLIPAELRPEAWRRIPQHPERYAVSILNSGVFDLENRQLVGLRPRCAGRIEVYLRDRTNSRKSHCYQLGRLVAEAVYGTPSNSKMQAAHLDDNPTNNHWANIEWQSPSRNGRTSGRKRHRFPSGAANRATKLTQHDLYLVICELSRGTSSITEVAKLVGASTRYVSDLARGRVRTAEMAAAAKALGYSFPIRPSP